MASGATLRLLVHLRGVRPLPVVGALHTADAIDVDGTHGHLSCGGGAKSERTLAEAAAVVLVSGRGVRLVGFGRIWLRLDLR